jgi:hypothetical protein
MANRQRRSHDIELQYAFDRLHAAKLEQVFAILVPNRRRRVNEPTGLRGENHEDSRNLRPSLVGPTEGGEDDCQSDSGASGVCPQRKLPGTG